ncbi:cytochrome c oxidase subunit II [Halorarius litoreus]|uniref:cytochrome c oxidase subunit II n=1 Tax=Halorarius litoreus TaxID=2962676 RepID=UPI0020CF4114|nr:cytochrome c oxidase subunit II [Halorarius litoreus]
MEIHRFEKLWLLASIVLVVSFIATVTYGAVGPGIAMVSDSGGTVDPSNPTASDNFREPGVYQTGENEYAVYVLARQFLFEPGTSEPIEVPVDSTVTFYVTSPDVQHGFNLVGTNVNAMVIPGQVAEFTVQFEEEKRHSIVCHEYCGSGHHTMSGNVTVVSQSEFDGGDA